MLKIKLVPDLDHCIETLARREYNETVGKLLSPGKEQKKLGKNTQKAELLRNFLETADFRRLRLESEKHLIKGKEVKFLLYPENGVTKHEMRVS